MKILFLCIACLSLAFLCAAQRITVNGYVKDAASKEILIDAIVANLADHSGTVTNQYGYFSIPVKTKDTIALLFSFAGYQSVVKKIASKTDIQIEVLLVSGTALQGVTISAARNDDNVKKPQMGVIDVPVSAIRELPALLGERDILKIIQLLPGVQQGAEGTAGFYVRGGNIDQNLIQLDEATLYNPNHLFGLVSTFNVNALNSVKLIKGGFPAQYGGRLSSILAVSMRDGSKTKYQGEAGIGLLAANLTLEGPIQKEKSSFIISGRQSYINLLLQPLTSNSTSYAFYDLNAKVNYELGNKDHFFLSAFRGNDNASYTGANSLNYAVNFGNSAALLRWNHIYQNGLFSNTSLIYNDYHLQLGTSQSNYYEVLYTGVTDVNAKTAFTASLNNNHTIRFGADYVYHTLFPGTFSAKIPKKGNLLNINKDSIERRFSNEIALYANDDYQATDKLSLSYGVRAPFFAASGKTYFFIEPRLTLQYLINTQTSVKASFTQMNQFVHLIANNTASLPADIWLSSNALIKPQSSTQYAIGLFKNFMDNDMEASAEVYYKSMQNQVLFKEGTVLSLTTNLDAQLTFGKGKSYGIELFVKKRFGRLTGWASYTLSRTDQQFAELNFGKAFPASFDRTHNLALVASYQLSKHWTLSADFVLTSGKPYTLPAGKIIAYDGGSLYDGYYYDYTNRNNSRLAAYNRSDISASHKKEATLFHKFHFTREWIFGLYNAYSRDNPYFVYLTIDPLTKQPQAKQVSLLPIVPAVSFNIKF